MTKLWYSWTHIFYIPGQAAVLNDTEGLRHALEGSKEVLASDEVASLEAFVGAGAEGLEQILTNPSQLLPPPETKEETKDSLSSP